MPGPGAPATPGLRVGVLPSQRLQRPGHLVPGPRPSAGSSGSRSAAGPPAGAASVGPAGRPSHRRRRPPPPSPISLSTRPGRVAGRPGRRGRSACFTSGTATGPAGDERWVASVRSAGNVAQLRRQQPPRPSGPSAWPRVSMAFLPGRAVFLPARRKSSGKPAQRRDPGRATFVVSGPRRPSARTRPRPGWRGVGVIERPVEGPCSRPPAGRASRGAFASQRARLLKPGRASAPLHVDDGLGQDQLVPGGRNPVGGARPPTGPPGWRRRQKRDDLPSRRPAPAPPAPARPRPAPSAAGRRVRRPPAGP